MSGGPEIEIPAGQHRGDQHVAEMYAQMRTMKHALEWIALNGSDGDKGVARWALDALARGGPETEKAAGALPAALVATDAAGHFLRLVTDAPVEGWLLRGAAIETLGPRHECAGGAVQRALNAAGLPG